MRIRLVNLLNKREKIRVSVKIIVNTEVNNYQRSINKYLPAINTGK